MPQIILKQPGQPVADFSVSGDVVTVAGVAVDCAAAQSDVGEVVEIRLHKGIAEIGREGAYLAQIEIPARRYEEIVIDEGSAEDVQHTILREAVPLDPNAVVVTLWPAY